MVVAMSKKLEYNSKDLKKIKKDLKKKLSEDRYIHTLGVANTAVSLAMCYGEDIAKAQYAGILHDSAKYLSNEEYIRECKKYKIKYDKVLKNSPSLLHGYLGATYSIELYDIDDEDIYNSIYNHTFGSDSMSLLEEIIYVADYIEPNRDYFDGLDDIRKLAFKDIKAAIAVISNRKIEYTKSKGQEVFEASYKTLDFYKQYSK